MIITTLNTTKTLIKASIFKKIFINNNKQEDMETKCHHLTIMHHTFNQIPFSVIATLQALNSQMVKVVVNLFQNLCQIQDLLPRIALDMIFQLLVSTQLAEINNKIIHSITYRIVPNLKYRAQNTSNHVNQKNMVKKRVSNTLADTIFKLITKKSSKSQEE